MRKVAFTFPSLFLNLYYRYQIAIDLTRQAKIRHTSFLYRCGSIGSSNSSRNFEAAGHLSYKSYKMSSGKNVDFLSCRLATGISGALGFLANLIVMVLIIKGKIKNMSEMRFFVSLCTIDMLFGIILTISISRTSSRTSETQSISSGIITVLLYCLILAGTHTRQSHLCIITYERFYAAKYPFKYKTTFAKAAKNKMLYFVWLVPCVVALFVGIFAFLSQFSQLLFLSGAVGLIATSIAMAYMYLMIIRRRRRARVQVCVASSSVAKGDHVLPQLNRQHEKERNLIKTSIIIVLSYIILNMPCIIFLFISDIQSLSCETVLGAGFNIALTFGSLNILSDPLIYFWHMTHKQKSQSTARVKMQTNSATGSSSVIA